MVLIVVGLSGMFLAGTLAVARTVAGGFAQHLSKPTLAFILLCGGGGHKEGILGVVVQNPRIARSGYVTAPTYMYEDAGDGATKSLDTPIRRVNIVVSVDVAV